MHAFIFIFILYSAEFANLTFIPPFLQPGFRHYDDGVNFASAGAGALVETFRGSVCNYNLMFWVYLDKVAIPYLIWCRITARKIKIYFGYIL